MKAYLLNLWDGIRTSYWFVPTLLALATVLLAMIMPAVDEWANDAGIKVPEWIRTTTETARSTLSTVAGAIVAVAGTVFSITIVTLSLASQQFGPRLLRRFMYDLVTQLTLGVFLSTSLYCLLILRIVESHEGGMAVPHFAVLTAVALTVLSMAMLIAFIHHIAMLIQAPNVVAAVARDLDDAIVRLFPEKIGQPPDHTHQPDGDAAERGLDGDGRLVRCTKEGYIQAIDGDGLLNFARENDLVLRLLARPGHYVAVDAPLARVWNETPAARNDNDDDEWATRINDAVIVGTRRTPRQDVECAIDELVEVAIRALSPGVNDPFTAVNCVDRLGASIGRLAERKLPSPYRFDDDDNLRVIAQTVAFGDVLNAAFNQIRQYGRGSVAVTIRLMEALTVIASRATRPVDRDAVRSHVEMINRVGETFEEAHDRKDLADRYDRLIDALNGEADS